MKFPRPLTFALQTAVLIALAVLLWRVADGRAALAHLQNADLWWLLAAAVVLTLQTVLSALRWRVTAAQLGLVIPLWAALREYYMGQVVNQSLPGGVIGDAGRAVRTRSTAGLWVATQAVVFERTAGQMGLMAVMVAGIGLGAVMPGAQNWPDWVVGWGLGLAACAVVVAGLLAALPRVKRFARAFADAVWAPKVRRLQITLSVGTAVCNVAAFGFCALALGVGLPVLAMATVIPVILFAMVLPLSVGGWGLREGAAAVLFPVMGATSAEGLASSIAFGVIFLATTLPGLVLPLVRPNAPVRPPAPRPMILPCAENSPEKEMQ